MITPVTSRTKIMLMMPRTSSSRPALYLPTFQALYVRSFRTSIMPSFSHGISCLSGILWVDETHKHKHQHHKNQYAKKRVQNTPHLRRAERFRQPLQRREEERNSGYGPPGEEADHHRSVTGDRQTLKCTIIFDLP